MPKSYIKYIKSRNIVIFKNIFEGYFNYEKYKECFEADTLIIQYVCLEFQKRYFNSIKMPNIKKCYFLNGDIDPEYSKGLLSFNEIYFSDNLDLYRLIKKYPEFKNKWMEPTDMEIYEELVADDDDNEIEFIIEE